MYVKGNLRGNGSFDLFFVFRSLYSNFITSTNYNKLLLTSNWNERYYIRWYIERNLYRNRLIVVAKLRRHLLAVNRINNIYSIERKFFEFLSVSTHVFFFFFFPIDKHRYLYIQIYLSTKHKNYVRNYESSATAKEQVSSPCVPSWPVTRGRSRTMIEVQLHEEEKRNNERRNYFSLQRNVDGLPWN